MDAYLSEDYNDSILAIYTQEPTRFGNIISQIRVGPVNWYHTDALGSTRALTGSNQVTSDTYIYDAWGNLVSSTGSRVNPFRWVGNVGYYFDAAIGSYYIRARTYQPTIARWTSVDPLMAWLALQGTFRSRDPIGYKGGFDIYAYVGQRVLNRVDPSGNISISATINAFISSRHDADGDGWIPTFVTTNFNGYVGTDRRLGGVAGTSRISKSMLIDSCVVGKFGPSDTIGFSSGTEWGELRDGRVEQTAFRVGVVNEHDGVYAYPNCKSFWSGQVWGNMPFISSSPNITMDGQVTFAAGGDIVIVKFDFTTTAFPDFEMLVSAGGAPCRPGPFQEIPSKYSHPSWGLLLKQSFSRSFTCNAPTRKKCCGSCANE